MITAPERTIDQRMDSLRRANEIRVERARTKEGIRRRQINPILIVADPPEHMHSMKICDLLLCIPKYGDTKVRKILRMCAVSDVKSLHGLTLRQREAIVRALRRDGL